jgi:glyoxylase-like metal-dependent hydrolase (beta-lactamase superfamily II)
MSLKSQFWNPHTDSCNVGKITIKRIVDLEFVPFAANLVFPDATQEKIKNLSSTVGMKHFAEKTFDLLLSFHSYLIQTDKYNILVDTCCGNDKDRATRPAWHKRQGPFLDNLKKNGLMASDIDIVLCTHLHADHVGWNTQLIGGKWHPTFSNAQYLFTIKEFEYWKNKNEQNLSEPIMYGSFDDSILPVIASGQASFVNSDHQIDDGVRIEPAYGHTPGNIIVHVESAKEHAVLCGDVIHHPLQLSKPLWSTNFCFDPNLSRQTRINLLETYADTETAILPAHFHSPDYGCIERHGSGFRLIN